MIIVNLPVSFHDLIVFRVALESLSMHHEDKKQLLDKLNKATIRFYKKERVSIRKWKKEQGIKS